MTEDKWQEELFGGVKEAVEPPQLALVPQRRKKKEDRFGDSEKSDGVALGRCEPWTEDEVLPPPGCLSARGARAWLKEHERDLLRHVNALRGALHQDQKAGRSGRVPEERIGRAFWALESVRAERRALALKDRKSREKQDSTDLKCD